MDAYVALLGILKAGAAYVPLDPDYPVERVRFILSDCQARALVTAGLAAMGQATGSLPALSAAIVSVDNGAAACEPALPFPGSGPGDRNSPRLRTLRSPLATGQEAGAFAASLALDEPGGDCRPA